MEPDRARQLLRAERERVESLLAGASQAAQENRDASKEIGDIADPAEPLTEQELDEALVAELRERLGALDRAEKRLQDGTYGKSVRSGAPIPDERLEADPAAELTVEEAAG